MLQTKHPCSRKEHNSKPPRPMLIRLSEAARQELIGDYVQYRERLAQSYYNAVNNEKTVKNYGNKPTREYPRGIARQSD